jgi:hypothetical protein
LKDKLELFILTVIVTLFTVAVIWPVSNNVWAPDATISGGYLVGIIAGIALTICWLYVIGHWLKS